MPQTLINLAERDDYSRGSCHISVTQLIDAPRIKILKEKHADDMVMDVSDNLWSMVGKALHHIAEAGADKEHLAEERLYADVLGWRLSGGIDLQKLGRKKVGVRDYKFTSVWAAAQDKPEWERQLNSYSWLAFKNKGLHTEDLQITALLRDWNRRDARKDKSYPQAPIMVVPVKLWSVDEQQAYVEERIRLHQEAWRLEEWEEELPLCSAEERWAKPDKWAVTKVDGKRASVLCNSQEAAVAWLNAQAATKASDPGNYTIDTRPGEQTRCASFCQASPWCTQYKSWLSEVSKNPIDSL